MPIRLMTWTLLMALVTQFGTARVITSFSGSKEYCGVPDAGCATLTNNSACGTYLGCSVASNSGLCSTKSVCASTYLAVKCGVKGLAFESAQTMLPACLRGNVTACNAQRQYVYDSLGLQTSCGDTGMVSCEKGGCTVTTTIKDQEPNLFAATPTWYVDPIFGQDVGLPEWGVSRTSPYLTLNFALAKSRTLPNVRRKIFLMAGTHRVLDTVTLTTLDSNLTIQGENGTVVSGAAPMDRIQWKPFVTNATNQPVMMATIPYNYVARLKTLSAMYVNGKPAIRARYPNIPSFFDIKYAPSSLLSNWVPRTSGTKPMNVFNVKILKGQFGTYTSATGGNCDGIFTPPQGYFCSPEAQAHGGCPYSIPSQVDLDGTTAQALRVQTWDMKLVHFHTFHPQLWGIWVFDLNAGRQSVSSRPTPFITFSPTTSKAPSKLPSRSPSRTPSTSKPTKSPSTSRPSKTPTTSKPSRMPSRSPIRRPTTSKPSKTPTTSSPSRSPSRTPSKAPSVSKPTLSPITSRPTLSPSRAPSFVPTTSTPTDSPVHRPTNSPTLPTSRPTVSPTNVPTDSPTTSTPSQRPTTSKPTLSPSTSRPTLSPTKDPTKQPIPRPTSSPTTSRPSRSPTRRPTRPTTRSPTLKTTTRPTVMPSKGPVTSRPSRRPTTSRPSKVPRTARPSRSPTRKPTKFTTLSTSRPSTTSSTSSPSFTPTTSSTTSQPSRRPSRRPSRTPTTARPSKRPSHSPATSSPTISPTTSRPSKSPSNTPTTSKPTVSPEMFTDLAESSFSPTVSPMTPIPTLIDEASDMNQRRSLSAGSFTLQFGFGGFQEARGDCQQGGNQWFIENALALLDSPNEYFLDLSNGIMYYTPSSDTDLTLPSTTVELSMNKVIFQVLGSVSNPVTDVTFVDLAFEKTYPTYMESHEAPSGGDWTTDRNGAIFIEGAERVEIYGCSFRYMGSHGVFLSRYVRDVVIQRSQFFALGGSGILLVGDPLFNSASPFDRTTDQNHVERVLISENMISDFGMVIKQSAGIFLSIAKSVVVRRNVVFNCPRAGIAFNDGFGGNTTIINNIVFNTVRETDDHGPFNVWDRQRWMQDPKVNPTTHPFQVLSNLVIGSAPFAYKGVDIDDGGMNFNIQGNVVFDSFQKFKGNNIRVMGNIIFPLPMFGSCLWMTPANSYPAGMVYQANACFILQGSAPLYYFNVVRSQATPLCKLSNFKASGNTYTGPQATVPWAGCGSKKPITTAQWTKKYKQDAGSSFAAALPPSRSQTAKVRTYLSWITPPQ